MKIYILLMSLLFTACVSNNPRTNTSTKTNKSLEVIVSEQGVEFKKLQEDNKEIKKDIENLNKRIQRVEEFYELN
ncbi:MAG: hypothetical protein WBG30_15305 [Psychrilyobacter sp.]|uniref:hypothetical protein n=1 Tax=Psychrilyobacter sp. TaxID=2586924 RepID=UPI003C74B63B